MKQPIWDAGVAGGNLTAVSQGWPRVSILASEKLREPARLSVRKMQGFDEDHIEKAQHSARHVEGSSKVDHLWCVCQVHADRHGISLITLGLI